VTNDADEIAVLSRSLRARLALARDRGVSSVPASRAGSTVTAPAPPPRSAPGGLPLAERRAALAAGAAEVASCRRCRLAESRTRTVYGVGNPEARLCFVGEGPGYDEDQQGEPFVGRAGQLLNKMIAAMGLARTDVYICNTVKCRPPDNRTPSPDEMEACGSYLERQLEVVRPEVLVALGRPAASRLTGSGEAMSKLRGRFHSWRGIPVMPTYHPAYLLRTPTAKRVVWEDLQLVMKRLGLAP
jgi:DNA polymerase